MSTKLELSKEAGRSHLTRHILDLTNFSRYKNGSKIFYDPSDMRFQKNCNHPNGKCSQMIRIVLEIYCKNEENSFSDSDSRGVLEEGDSFLEYLHEKI